jgi:hypothetical protein
MRHGPTSDDEPFFRRSVDDFMSPPPINRWHRTVDWLGARRPLTLIAGACAIIALIRYAAHLIA